MRDFMGSMSKIKLQRKKSRIKRGRTALSSAAGALFYEWKTAKDDYALINIAREDRNQALMNAALESFLIHARNIRDFFRVSGRDNDILVSDFLGNKPRVRMPKFPITSSCLPCIK